jgi:hypothetical protein
MTPSHIKVLSLESALFAQLGTKAKVPPGSDLTPDQIAYEHTRKLIQQKLSGKAEQLVGKHYLPLT